MSQRDDIDDARAALIDQRIGQAFDFIGDVIEDSRLLEVIPDGSRLAFRDVAIGQFSFRLTAFQSPDSRGRWHALVTGYRSLRSQVGSTSHQQTSARTLDGAQPAASTTGKTAALALDALEAELRALVTMPA